AADRRVESAAISHEPSAQSRAAATIFAQCSAPAAASPPGGRSMNESKKELSGQGFFTESAPIRTVADLQRLDRQFGRSPQRPRWRTGGHWAFRGHSNAHGGLQSKLEHAYARHRIAARDRSRCEQLLIREFGRKAYLYLPDSELPSPGDTLEWLSLMRH